MLSAAAVIGCGRQGGSIRPAWLPVAAAMRRQHHRAHHEGGQPQ